MIFNLNEQKVLSDPSGSSVFKGEKDFNDIVVNLPDNIDGHTATELNYVMHFVDSDGGYSTKILTVDSSGETLKATATVSTNITSKAQAFYAYVLMTDDEETVIGKTNGVIVMIHPVPDEENEIIPPADADKIIKGLEEIVKEATETIEEATKAISSKQDKLTAGDNITIDEDNVISVEGGGVTSYDDLTDKPTVYSERSSSSTPLTGELTFSRQFSAGRTHENDPIYIEVRELARGCLENWSNYFVGNQLNINAQYSDMYDFNNFGSFDHAVASYPAGFYNCVGKNLRNTPQVFSDSIGDYTRVVIMHYNTIISLITRRYMLRTVYFQDSATNKVRQFAQWIYYDTENNPIVHAVTDWCEIGGGSQIVSGVVNANGTITFTDSDGNTFTTSGSSVIGADGFSPVATVTQTASGATVSITDKNGTTTANISNGQNGNDYVLTAQDKSDIADIVLSELPTTQGVLYGNTSN